MQLTSSAFRDGTEIPRRYTCDGDNISPPLAWNNPPTGTRSFAIICSDPDAPGGTWHHWAIFDIPAEQRALTEHVARTDIADGSRQAKNDFHKSGYDGPCPPHGHGPHHYQFRLIALSVEHLPVERHPTCVAVVAKLKDITLGEARLTGRYER